MFERHKGGEVAIVVHMNLPDANDCLDEFVELASSSGAELRFVIECSRRSPEAKYFIGSGKAMEVKEAVQTHGADVVLFNHDLSPSQERNLEALIQCRVLSRAGLILDIFAQRARTFEGKLQVELAQLQHLQTRLIRGWTHLERQKGGIGLRGPGETQLETDRRLLRARIKSIEAKLKKVRSQREQNRQARRKAELPVVSLVGYTNAGKSTLFNALAQESSMAEDKLFATLDPLMRKVNLPSGNEVILADTVGFIQNLPHQLIEAFQGTLEETKNANLLLHVIDISSKNYRDNMAVVHSVLKEIKADTVPQIWVFNKIDNLSGVEAEATIDEITKVWLSAQTGEGVDKLLQVIDETLNGKLNQYEVALDPRQGKLRAWLYEKNAILQETIDEKGTYCFKVKLTPNDYQYFKQQLED